MDDYRLVKSSAHVDRYTTIPIYLMTYMEGRESCSGLSRVVEDEESCREFLINQGMLVSESEEEEEESDGSLFSIDIDSKEEDRVYVAVGKHMDALAWTLNHAITPSTIVHLIHVFPLIHLVPSPLGGMLPKGQANPKVVETYLGQQREKRKKALRPYVEACSEFKVRVETMLVESDNPGKAILELIPSLNIKRLVMGSTKSSLRKVKLKRGTAGQILERAPETCEINIICKGKQVMLDRQHNHDSVSIFTSPSPSPSQRSSKENEEPSHIRSSPSHTAVHPWNVFRWVHTKPSHTPHQLPLATFYQSLLK